MPSIGEQFLLHDAVTADFLVARALLRPGRTYATAVDAFAPYAHVQDENPELRGDLATLAKAALELRIPAYLIVNNRAEGSAPSRFWRLRVSCSKPAPGDEDVCDLTDCREQGVVQEPKGPRRLQLDHSDNLTPEGHRFPDRQLRVALASTSLDHPDQLREKFTASLLEEIAASRALRHHQLPECRAVATEVHQRHCGPGSLMH